METDAYAAPGDPDAESTGTSSASAGAVPGSRSVSSTPSAAGPRPSREVGELEIRGTSVTSGYYRRPDATEAAFHDGWLRTGDLGYLVDGELVVCGRIKDVIIVGGRNVYPEEVERAAASVDGVRAGNVIAFGVDGRRGQEAFVVVAESKDPDLEAVRAAVAGRVREVVGPAAGGGRAGRAGVAPQDLVGQAPALAVPLPLSERGALASLRGPNRAPEC